MPLTGRTQLYAILAHPVDHVRAPTHFNAHFDKRGLDRCLVPLHVPPQHLREVVSGLRRLPNLWGMVITIPHKETMLALVDEVREGARLVGAANAIRVAPDGRLIADNFDGLGLVDAMRADGIEPKGARILQLGAGGAGKATAFAFAQAGAAALTLYNRENERAVALADAVKTAFPTCEVRAGTADPAGHDLIVNCTSLGMHEGDAPPLDLTLLRPTHTVVDIIATRDHTELLVAARDLGCRYQNGLGMVVQQIERFIAFFDEGR